MRRILALVLATISDLLATHFPHGGGRHNELPNEPVAL